MVRKAGMNFEELVDSIMAIHQNLLAQVSRAVNTGLTLRNWFIGMYICEYEQCGKDRAAYGERLVETLAETMRPMRIPRTDARELRRYRLFYLLYPEIRESLSPELRSRWLLGKDLGDAVSQISGRRGLDAALLVSRLSFSHFVEFIGIDDDTKRLFYEVECVKGNWSVRELKRQIGSLYYERSGLSRNKEKLALLANQGQRNTNQNWRFAILIVLNGSELSLTR